MHVYALFFYGRMEPNIFLHHLDDIENYFHQHNMSSINEYDLLNMHLVDPLKILTMYEERPRQIRFHHILI